MKKEVLDLLASGKKQANQMLVPDVFSVKWSDAQWQVKLAVQTQADDSWS